MDLKIKLATNIQRESTNPILTIKQIINTFSGTTKFAAQSDLKTISTMTRRITHMLVKVKSL